MNFFAKFSSVAGAAAKPPKRPRLVAVWTIDPRTGKPKRVWRRADAADGSCRGRPGGPPSGRRRFTGRIVAHRRRVMEQRRPGRPALKASA